MGVGYVISSRSPLFKKGNFVSGFLGWQEFATVNGSEISKLPSYENPQLYLGVLGLPGLTAYFAVTEVAKPSRKEVMVVSSAAGSVGSIACQIGKMKGCKVIGICGSDNKCKWLVEDLKVDAVVNYKAERHLAAAIRKTCPQGVDIFIDCVGGKVLDAVLANIRKNARLVMCGTTSAYELEEPSAIHNYPYFLGRVAIAMSASFEGFVVWDYQNRFEMGIKQLNRWTQEKKIVFKEQVVDGLEFAPHALRMNLDGENNGKMIVKVLHNTPHL
jgi:NADPH-dependent curcumin reductase CurA